MENETEQKMLRGRCSWRMFPGIGNLLNQICSGNMTWTCGDLRSTFKDFSQQASSFVRSTAVCSATFRRDLILQLLNPDHIISAVTALQATAQLEVACLICCVLCNEHLSIDRSVCHFFGLACCCLLRLLYHCYASSRPIVT